MQYRVLNIENQNLIVSKAKLKKDGIYGFRGIIYRVKNNSVTHFCAEGKIVQPSGYFNCDVGNYEDGVCGESNARKLMKSLN
jgi:hypothetical protein